MQQLSWRHSSSSNDFKSIQNNNTEAVNRALTNQHPPADRTGPDHIPARTTQQQLTAANGLLDAVGSSHFSYKSTSVQMDLIVTQLPNTSGGQELDF